MAARGGGVKLHFKVDAERTSREFKEARARINERTKEGLRVAGERVALPEAKRRAPRTSSTRGLLEPGELAASLVVRPRIRDAYLTTTLPGVKHRIVGLHEFGSSGYPLLITPKQIKKREARRREREGHTHAKALPIGGGLFRASVKRGRYRGQHFLEGAVHDKQEEIAEAVLEETLKAFEDIPHEP